ncbi:MAG: hypothetical protein LBE13_07855 [Bacteroidales bacterium]|nr:hypothetical protein [Bacteroidales bacterium]
MIIIICLILFSCNSINIIGNWSGKRNRNNLDLNLDQDSTYTYCFSNYNEQIRDYSEGKWRKNEKNIIIINSNIQNNIIPLEIFYEKMKKNENQLCISIILKVFNQYPYGSDNEDDYVCEPFTNDTIPLREQLTGEDMFNAMATNSDPYTGRGGSYTIYSDTLINDVWFEISRTFYTGTYFIEQPIRTERKKINCSLGDSIVINININDDLFNYKVFNNKTLKIKNNRIIFYNNNEYNDKIKLKKQNDESW